MPENDSITKDAKKLKKLSALVPKDVKPIAEKIIAEIQFMSETLEKLKADINLNGVVDNFKQGQQQFVRESPALKAYNTTIQRYSLLYKQLTDLLPKEEQQKQRDELIDFIKDAKRKK